MSWSYSGNPADSELDKLRFIVGDTNPDEPVLQDEEIQFLILQHGDNENVLRYHLFVLVATIFSRDIKRSLGPQAEDPTERLKFFKEQIAYYRSKLVSAGISLPRYASPKVFRKGMQSNPPWPSPKGGDYV
jgi:hypothetical protein